MTKKTKNTKPFKNQWIIRSNDEIQKIINKFPLYTKKDFRGEGKKNKRKILTRKETERPGLIFGHKGNKLPLQEVYKYSSSESILRFEKGIITEENFRNNSKSKKKRNATPIYLKKKQYKERHANLTEAQLMEKRRRDKEYRDRIKNN